MTWQTLSKNSAATEKLGAALGQNLKGGEVIELVSDIGGGKTTFVRGLVRGAGSPDHVSSPTFTISHVYKTPKFEIHHFDFYRLTEPGVISHELAESIDNSDVVVALEWSQIVKNVLPKDRLTITFQSADKDSRTLNFAFPKIQAYLLKGIKS